MMKYRKFEMIIHAYSFRVLIINTLQSNDFQYTLYQFSLNIFFLCVLPVVISEFSKCSILGVVPSPSMRRTTQCNDIKSNLSCYSSQEDPGMSIIKFVGCDMQILNRCLRPKCLTAAAARRHEFHEKKGKVSSAIVKSDVIRHGPPTRQQRRSMYNQ